MASNDDNLTVSADGETCFLVFLSLTLIGSRPDIETYSKISALCVTIRSLGVNPLDDTSFLILHLFSSLRKLNRVRK